MLKYTKTSTGRPKDKKKFHKKFNQVRSLKEGRIIVRNLPFKATEESIKKFFDTFGPIREVNLLKRPDGNPVGCAFVQFNNINVAKKAIENCSRNEFMGRQITADLALERGRYITSRPDLAAKATDNTNQKYGKQKHDEYTEEGYDEDMAEEGSDEDAEESKPYVEFDDEGTEVTKPAVGNDDGNEIKPDLGDEERKKKTEKDKKRKADWKRKTKKARVVVRNLSFKATEEDLKTHFGAYGELVDVNLLRKPDGRMVGCGFLQYVNLKQAAFAIKHASGLKFLGRPVILDWAVPKREYKTKNKSTQDVEVKEEPLDADEIKIEEDDDEIESIKSEHDSDVDSENDRDEEDNYEDEEDMDLDEDTNKTVTKPPQKYFSNDVSEGRTVFVKNIPFSVNHKEFRECMQRFGELEYGVICYDPLTEHSKGTGFAKFKDLASTQKCLEAGTELTLHGQVLDCHKALDRETIKAKGKESTEKKTSKDNRNLYLVKEGVVLAGSKAAENVSVTDMAKRLKLEQVKTQMLRNLNMFVSNNRLIVHNLPATYDDQRLRELFLSHAGPKAAITEARVMRNMANVDENGIGQSKEIGFVRFTTQEDAITALRKINNNPHIFTVSKRPIVTFAIENRMIHKIKQQREQKSRDKNPLYNKPQETTVVKEKKMSSKRRKKLEKRNSWWKVPGGVGAAGSADQTMAASTPQSGGHAAQSKNWKVTEQTSDNQAQSNGQPQSTDGYTGVVAERGNTKMRSKYNLKTQASLHTKVVRKDIQKKKSNKKAQQQLKVQREHIKQPKQKQGSQKSQKSTKEDDSFNKLVNTYKTKITPEMIKKKWYDP